MWISVNSYYTSLYMVDNNSRCIVYANKIRVDIDRNVIVIISWSLDNWVLGNREKKLKHNFFERA